MLAATKWGFTDSCNASSGVGLILVLKRLPTRPGETQVLPKHSSQAPELPARDTPKYQEAPSHATDPLFIIMYIAHMQSTGPNAGCSLPICLLLPLSAASQNTSDKHAQPPAGRHWLTDCPTDADSQDGPITHPMQAEIPSWRLEGAWGEENCSTSLKR